MVKKLLTLFVLTSFYTHSILPLGLNSILGRISYSDFFGLMALIISIPKILSLFKNISKISRIYTYAFIMISTFFIPFVFSLSPAQTLVETLIHYFLILISIVFFDTFKDKIFTSLFPIIINTMIIAAVLGFYDLIASFTGFPRIFPSRNNAELVAGFRNAGQAGAYFMVFLAILYPLKNSIMKEQLSNTYKKRLNIAIILSILFLFSTGKIAAYIGFSIGVIIYAIMSGKIKTIFSVFLLGVFFFFAFNNLEKISPDLYRRINGKIQSRVVQNIDGSSNSTFFQTNYGKSLQAFFDRPITGTGLGGFQGNYHQNEVHSTYLKMLGETGLFGVIGYILFISTFLLLFLKPKRTYKDNPYNDYLFKMIPFIIGCLISWSYTYHLRKREFWIMVAILVIVKYQAKLWNYNKTLKLKK